MDSKCTLFYTAVRGMDSKHECLSLDLDAVPVVLIACSLILTYLDAVLIVREDVGGCIVGAQRGASRAVAQ